MSSILCCCFPDVFVPGSRTRTDDDDGDTTDDDDGGATAGRLANAVGIEDEDDDDSDAQRRFGRHHGRRHGRRRTPVEGSLLDDAHRRERSDDIAAMEEYDAMRRESSASAPPVGMRNAGANAVTTTSRTPRAGGSEAFYFGEDDGRKGEKDRVGPPRHRRSVSMAVGEDGGEIADVDLLAIKREFARTKSSSFERRGAANDGDKLEDGLSKTMSKMLSDDYDATCPTCFEEYDEENPRITLGCGHHFHLPCVLEWQEYLELQGREDTCPVCDAPIVLDGF